MPAGSRRAVRTAHSLFAELSRRLRSTPAERLRRVRVRVPDPVKRQFTATRPGQLWVADFTYVATQDGFVYVAFIIDVYARCIVGRRAVYSMKARLVFDALDQALCARRHNRDLIHHSDKGSRYLSVCYSDRLSAAGIRASTGTVGDAYDNALAESIIGLFKTEVLGHKGPWSGLAAVEYATLTWVDWFNNRRLLGSIGNIPPVEKEKEYHRLESSGCPA